MIMIMVVAVIMRMIADAGILQVVTGGALGEIHGEFLDHRLFARLAFHLDHDGEIVALGESLVGDETIAVLREGHADRVGAFSRGDAHDLFADRDRLEIIVQRGDFHLPIFRHEELEAGLGLDEEHAPRWVPDSLTWRA